MSNKHSAYTMETVTPLSDLSRQKYPFQILCAHTCQVGSFAGRKNVTMSRSFGT